MAPGAGQPLRLCGSQQICAEGPPQAPLQQQAAHVGRVLPQVRKPPRKDDAVDRLEDAVQLLLGVVEPAVRYGCGTGEVQVR